MKNSNISTVFLNYNLPSKHACFMKNLKNVTGGPIIGPKSNCMGTLGNLSS
jgi:hypothetical protein